MKKIYCQRAGFGGDIVISTVAVRVLSEQNPSVEITYGCWKKYEPLLELNPRIARVVGLGQLFLSDFDALVDFRHEKAPPNHHEYWGKIHTRQAAEATGLLIDLEDITDWTPEIWIDDEELPEKVDPRRPMVVFSHWTTNGRNWRLWPLERWEELSVRFSRHGFKTVLVGAPGEPHISVDVNMVGRTHWRLTAGITAIADLVVSVDTFTAHAAHAYKRVVGGASLGPTPTVLINGPMPPDWIVPPSAKCVVASQYRECHLGRPCGRSHGNVICQSANACMRDLTVEEVWAKCEEALALNQ